MKVRVVTIDREYGSGANVIAKELADRLGWKLWDQALTNEIARLARCEGSQVAKREERMDPLYYRMLKSFLRGSYEGSLNVRRLNLLDADSIFRLSQRLIKAAAEEGNAVIVGRGSAFFLENRPDAFHVFIYAPYEDKVRRLIRGGMEPNEAARLVDTVDNDRADFIRQFFDKEWPDRHLYHLMINSRVGDEAVVRAILNGMTTHEEHTTPARHSKP
jgi:cytidylate kinase